ncbi:hypothetical protein MBANPS3_011869 [Mucor bainieri]
MRLYKKLTSRLCKVLPSLNPSIDEFEIVTMPMLSNHTLHSQSRDKSTSLISPAISTIASRSLQPQQPSHNSKQQQQQQQQDKKKKRRSMVGPAGEQDLLLQTNGMLAEAKRS